MDGIVGVAVCLGHLRVKIQLQLANHITWDVCLRQGGDEVQRLGGVIRHKCIHHNLVIGDTESVGNTLWEVCEDLARRVVGADDEWEVQSIVETDLDQSGVGR